MTRRNCLSASRHFHSNCKSVSKASNCHSAACRLAMGQVRGRGKKREAGARRQLGKGRECRQTDICQGCLPKGGSCREFWPKKFWGQCCHSPPTSARLRVRQTGPPAHLILTGSPKTDDFRRLTLLCRARVHTSFEGTVCRKSELTKVQNDEYLGN